MSRNTLDDGLVELRNLVPLGQVRVEVLLAVPVRDAAYASVERHASERRESHSLRVRHGKRSRVSEAHGAHERVWCSAVLVRARAESLGFRFQLDVRLDAAHDFVLAVCSV